MNTKLALFFALITAALAVPALAGQAKAWLQPYEAVSSALANDDLASAKTAAAELTDEAKSAGHELIARHAAELAKSSSLDQAREHFKAMSAEAVKRVDGNGGYQVMQCPMADATWVQSEKKVMNPYMGKRMQQCGQMMDMKKGMKGMMKNGMMHGDDQADANGAARCCPMMG